MHFIWCDDFSLCRDKEGWIMLVGFVNMLMNDANYLVNEGLTKLGEIHAIQVMQQNQESYNSKPVVFIPFKNIK